MIRNVPIEKPVDAKLGAAPRVSPEGVVVVPPNVKPEVVPPPGMSPVAVFLAAVADVDRLRATEALFPARPTPPSVNPLGAVIYQYIDVTSHMGKFKGISRVING